VDPQQGLHSRYRPAEQKHDFNYWTNQISVTQKQQPHLLPQVYKQCTDDFKPCFHKWFPERFPSPSKWYSSTLQYTRSVACSSIIGYIIGLGDRHQSNILVDQSNADVVHIDLGIAFDLGKVLRIPEIVPFRLTRDIVDGMGLMGTQGTFRSCCEETLRVLRMNEELLMTVMQVFVYDPLYKWSLSPDKINNLRNAENNVGGVGGVGGGMDFDRIHSDKSISMSSSSSSSLQINQPLSSKSSSLSTTTCTTIGTKTWAFDLSEHDESIHSQSAHSQCDHHHHHHHRHRHRHPKTNAAAQAALIRVQNRLRGQDFSQTNLSIDAQVNRLISEAVDPDNLCKMYAGWHAYV
jgi:phosphatidylinositol kinase/protein kinase (PI-3  family)